MDLLRDLLQEFVPGIRLFIWSLQSKVCVSRSEVQKERPREPPRRHFSEPFRSKTKTRLCFFPEFVSGSLFETFFRLFLKFWRLSNFEGNPFKAKTYWYLEISSFFQFGALFRKKCVFQIPGSEKIAPGSSQEALQHLSFYGDLEILCVFQVFVAF